MSCTVASFDRLEGNVKCWWKLGNRQPPHYGVHNCYWQNSSYCEGMWFQLNYKHGLFRYRALLLAWVLLNSPELSWHGSITCTNSSPS